jgi:hypothetical protein
MVNSPAAKPVDSQTVVKTAPVVAKDPSKYDEMITDLLKHLTTLNTGLLAIIAAFNQEIIPIFRLNPDFTTAFLLTFFTSLALCMTGFVTTIVFLHTNDAESRARAYRAREIMVVVAAAGYIFSLMILLALFAWAYQTS